MFCLHENEIKLNESLIRQAELENDFKRTDMFKLFDALVIQKEIENKKILKEKLDLEEKLKNLMENNNNLIKNEQVYKNSMYKFQIKFETVFLDFKK